MITIHGPVLLDLNTQRDLLNPDGAYPLHQFASILDPLKKLFVWAARQRTPVVSTRLRHLHAPGQRGANRLVCAPETPGYQKLPFTLLRRRQEMPLDCGTDVPVEGFRIQQQWIFDLPGLNPFECPRLDRLLSESQAHLWILVGGPLEWTLRTAVLGLLQRRHRVAVVRDAIGQWDPYEGDMALRQVESKNIQWFTVAEVLERFGKPTPVPQPVNPDLPPVGVRKGRPMPTPPPSPARVPAKSAANRSKFPAHRELRPT